MDHRLPVADRDPSRRAPGREEATERIASVLRRNGLLWAMHVPLNLTGSRQLTKSVVGAQRQPTLWLGKWAYDIPAHTSAPLAEAVSAAVHRLYRPGHYRRQAVVNWRNGETDISAARHLVRGHGGGALMVLGWRSKSLQFCAETSRPGFLYAQMDIWGVNRSLVREASAHTGGGEPLLERDLVFEENATLAVSRASHFIVESERMAQRVFDLSGVPRPTIVLGLGVDLPSRLRTRDQQRRPLRVLSVARVGYAKGIHYVAEAIRAAGEHVQSTIVAGGGGEAFPNLRHRSTGLQFVGQRSSPSWRGYTWRRMSLCSPLLPMRWPEPYSEPWRVACRSSSHASPGTKGSCKMGSTAFSCPRETVTRSPRNWPSLPRTGSYAFEWAAQRASSQTSTAGMRSRRLYALDWCPWSPRH